MKKITYLLVFALSLTFIISCGGGSKVKVSEQGELLMSTAWKLNTNATINSFTDTLQDATNIVADVELTGDVEELANFFAETLVFDFDKSDKSKLAYSSTVGEGLLSSEVVGYWTMSEDSKEITMSEWDNTNSKELAPVTYIIVELTKDKLVLQNKSDKSMKVFDAKK